MGFMRRVLFLSLFALAACGDKVQDNHFATHLQENEAAPTVTSEAVPVRIGDLGPSFPACNAAGATRNVGAGEALPVRSAPFDTAPEAGKVPAGGRFFICTRSLDEKWFGIVYDNGVGLAQCGVSEPVSTHRAYSGPCGAGWVSSPYVKFVASADQSLQADGKVKPGE